MSTKSNRYRNDYSLEAELNLDDPAVRHELDPIAEPNKPEPVTETLVDGKVVNVTPDAELSPEEVTYKKRYGDLRSFQQKRDNELKAEIEQLRQQLNAATKQEFKLPKSDDEYDKWAKEFPDVAAMVETAAGKKAKELMETSNVRFEQIEKMREDVERDKALNKIKTKHPDFDELRDDQKFHDWAEAQPKWVRDALYVENDPDGAIRAIDLYKYDHPKSPVKEVTQAQNNRSAAQNIAPRGKPELSNAPDGNDGKILESWVAKLTPKQFDKYEDQIDAAVRSGKFVYDLTAGAR